MMAVGSFCVCGHQSSEHWADWDGIHSCEAAGCECQSFEVKQTAQRECCTCVGSCKGADGLGPGWRCVMVDQCSIQDSRILNEGAIELGRQMAGVAFAAGRQQQTSAGDLYLAALDEWFVHCLGCNADTCETCAVVLNQARLARKVWESSTHKKVNTGA